MRAAVWHAAKDVRVEDVPAPRDPAPDEAIVQVAFSGICGTDLHEYVDGPHFILIPSRFQPRRRSSATSSAALFSRWAPTSNGRRSAIVSPSTPASTAGSAGCVGSA